MLHRYYYASPVVSSDWYDYVLANVGNLRCLYPLDEASGTDMFDLSANALHGTYTNAPTLGITGPVTGHTAATFNGTDEYGSVSHNSAFDLGTSDFSIGFWWKGSQPGASSFAFDHSGGGASNEWEVYFSSTSEQIVSRIAGVSVSKNNITVHDSSWHLICVTADRDSTSGGKIWVDGVQNGTSTDISTGSATAIDYTGTLYVARRASTGYLGGSLAGAFLAASLVDVAALWAAR
jgi:hypothetical protein